MKHRKLGYRLALLFVVFSLALTGCGPATDPTPAPSQTQADTANTTDATKENNNVTTEPQYKNMWKYSTDAEGVIVRDVTVKTQKGGDPLTVIQLSDIHFNFINDQDRQENHELTVGSYNDLNFQKDGKQLNNLSRCLTYAEGADQLIVTGDVISYLSHGNLQAVHTYIWDKYPEALITLGNHDLIRSWNGAADESATKSERYAIVEQYWKHDLFYSSKVLDERVMLIQMDNASSNVSWGEFLESQIEPLRADLALAREKGYTVLLFYHIPLSTGRVEDYRTNALRVGDNNTATVNFYTNGIGNLSTGASKKVYELIVNNADIIAGTFCGHKHSDFYTEIKAKNADGTEAVIPQYVLMGLFYEKGHVLRITVE